MMCSFDTTPDLIPNLLALCNGIMSQFVHVVGGAGWLHLFLMKQIASLYPAHS